MIDSKHGDHDCLAILYGDVSSKSRERPPIERVECGVPRPGAWSYRQGSAQCTI